MESLRLKVKRPSKKRKRTLTQKDRDMRNKHTLTWITNKWKTGDLDLDKPSHRIAATIAVSKGLIPKEALLDEEE